MRIILDTDKKTITVPWNYQKKLKSIKSSWTQPGMKANRKPLPDTLMKFGKKLSANQMKALLQESSPPRPLKRQNNHGGKGNARRVCGNAQIVC